MGTVLSLELKKHSAEAEHHEIVSLCTSQTTGAGAREDSGGHGEGGCNSEARREAGQRLERSLDTGAGMHIA